jgi:hypothetical protein
MGFSAGQGAGVGAAARSSAPQRFAPRPTGHGPVQRLGRTRTDAIPSGPRVGHSPTGGTDSFCPVILPIPTFGKSRPGYLSSMPWISGASDDQQASPAAVTGPARIPGSNDG